MKQSGATQTSRLDKADILELTVSYVKLIQFEEAEVSMATTRQYKSGYLSCARAALNFMDKSLNVNQTVKADLQSRLMDRCERISATENDQSRTILQPPQPIKDSISIEIPTASFSNEIRQGQTSVSNQLPDGQITNNTGMLAIADNLCETKALKRSSSRTDSFIVNKNIQYTLNRIHVTQNKATHPLNLSTCDSSFNGDVWRPW